MDRAGDGTPDSWGFVVYHYIRDYMNFVWTNGGSMFNSDRTRFTLNSPAATEALQFVADTALVHNVSPRSYSQKQSWDYWWEGLAGMYPTGSWDKIGRAHV